MTYGKRYAGLAEKNTTKGKDKYREGKTGEKKKG